MVSNLHQHGYSEGNIISHVRISPTALRSIENTRLNVKLFSQGQLYKTLINFEKYKNLLRQNYKSGNVGQFFVMPACVKKFVNMDGQFDHDYYESLDDYIDSWLLEDGRNHVSILGEFGSGKTWFCYHYAHRQLVRYEANPSKERFPLLISLQNYSKFNDVKDLISKTLQESYGLNWSGDYDLIDELT